MKETAVVVGASSGLGKAMCAVLASRGYNLILSSRKIGELTKIALDLKSRYAIEAEVIGIDLSSLDSTAAAAYVEKCLGKSNNIKQVYLTAATINNHDSGDQSEGLLKEIFDTNFFGIARLFHQFALILRSTGGNIAVISSIAAIRARGQNITYSSSKIALENFVLGLRHHYADKALNIQIYRIGYMDTAMSQGKKLLLTPVPPENVARYIIKHRNKNFSIRYYPGYWSLIALVLTCLPWFIYKKLRF